MNIVEKGMVHILGLYDGTPITFVLPKSDYTEFAKDIKEGGRKTVSGLLSHLGTKDSVADVLIKQIETLHNKILAISTIVDEDILERAWGADYLAHKAIWFMNISALLHLKRIKNDNMHGWLLMDHNSIVSMNHKEGPTISVFGDSNATAMMKKANELMAFHNRLSVNGTHL
jgi:hypothetical protein